MSLKKLLAWLVIAVMAGGVILAIVAIAGPFGPLILVGLFAVFLGVLHAVAWAIETIWGG